MPNIEQHSSQQRRHRQRIFSGPPLILYYPVYLKRLPKADYSLCGFCKFSSTASDIKFEWELLVWVWKFVCGDYPVHFRSGIISKMDCNFIPQQPLQSGPPIVTIAAAHCFIVNGLGKQMEEIFATDKLCLRPYLWFYASHSCFPEHGVWQPRKLINISDYVDEGICWSEWEIYDCH